MDTHGSCDSSSNDATASVSTLGKSEADINVAMEAAARKALRYWGRPPEDLGDLVQDIWIWYLARPSVRKFVSNADTETGRRNALYHGAVQILSENQADDNVFRGECLYSSDVVKDWLKGESTNGYLGSLITAAFERLCDSHLDAIRARYERHEEQYLKPGAPAMLLSRAVKSLTELVNALHREAKEDDPVIIKRASSVQAQKRRQGGGYSDPTADTALGLMAGGDNVIELHDGSTSTYRKEFEEADKIFATRYDQPSLPWVGLDLFEGELNDRTGMYRAQVFPELYPNEKPMLIENWPLEDKQAYCGGEYTEGYRRLKVVK